MTEDKINQTINNYITHAQKHVLQNKKNFSSWNTIYHKFIKKDNIDPAFDYTKEIIKRMEKDKMSSQSAMQVAETLMPEMQNVKKRIVLMAVPMVLGAVLLITFSLLFSFTRPFSINNHFVIYYAVGMLVSGILLGYGLIKRNQIKLYTVTRTMLFQACTAYGAAKMQGQGSFGAFRILDEMKTKQGKELQIKITQPKIMYK
jgi:hypothetical protein